MRFSLIKKIILPNWSNTKISWYPSKRKLCLTNLSGSNNIYLNNKINIIADNSQIILSVCSISDIAILNTLYSIVKASLLDLHLLYTLGIQLKGVNFRFLLTENFISLFLNKSKPLDFLIPSDIKISISNVNKDLIVISGVNRNSVLSFAYKLRAECPPNSYTGNGLTFEDEILMLKTGKKK